jgi:nitrogen fixation/metabolism regulation signal transduction histidine kinase
MTEINFLTQRRLTLTKVGEKDAVYQKYSMWVFIGVISLFLIATGLNLYFSQQLSNLNQREKNLTSQISSEESTELTFLLFSHKLKTVKDLYQNRSNKQQAIDYFSNLFGSQVFLSGMSYGGTTGSENSLSLRLTGENIFALEKLLNTLDMDDVKQAFTSIKKSGLRRENNGTYSVDIAVELLKQGEVSGSSK